MKINAFPLGEFQLIYNRRVLAIFFHERHSIFSNALLIRWKAKFALQMQNVWSTLPAVHLGRAQVFDKRTASVADGSNPNGHRIFFTEELFDSIAFIK